MAMYVGLDVSLKTTSICVVESDGLLVWEGKADSELTALVKAFLRWRDKIALVGIETCPLSEGRDRRAISSRVSQRPKMQA